MNLLKNRKGFTLIELIIVIAIIAVLVLLAAPKFMNYVQEARAVAVKQDCKTLENALYLYEIEEPDEEHPAVTEVELEELEDDVLEAINAVLGSDLETSDFGYVDGTNLQIKTLSKPIDKFVVVTEGEDRGDVFYIGGDVKDGNGNLVVSQKDYVLQTKEPVEP